MAFKIATDMIGLFAYIMVVGGLSFEPWDGRIRPCDGWAKG